MQNYKMKGSINSGFEGYSVGSQSGVFKGKGDGFDPLKMEFSSKRIMDLPGSNRGIDESMLSRSFVNNQHNSAGNALYESNVRNVIRGLPSLPETRLLAIARAFMSEYGNASEINVNGMMRIQREAYAQCTAKISINDETANDLMNILDQNRDKRVTEDDIFSLCRRYLSCEKRPIIYTSLVEERLAVAKRLFDQFDVEKVGFLTAKQVPNLLSETYKALGKAFNATDEDVKSWMQLTNTSSDGRVTFSEYEQSIIRALKKQGIQIYND